MAEHKLEPVAVKVQDAVTPRSTAPSTDTPEAQPSTSSQGRTSVRMEVLDAVVNFQAQRIVELERMVDKKRAKCEELSASQPFVHPSQVCILPPGAPSAPPTSVPPSSNALPSPSTVASALPKAATVGTSAQPGMAAAPSHIPHSAMMAANPLAPHGLIGAQNPVMAAAIAAVGPPQVSGPLPAAHFPFVYPHADHPAMAAMMGVLPAQMAPQPAPAASVPTTSQAQNAEAGDRKQSRYWTAEEHQRFLAAVNTCGPKNYIQISEFVGTRNAKQVRTHAQKFQKRLEREDAKRRKDIGGGVLGTGGSVGATAAAVVAAAAAEAMHGNVPGVGRNAMAGVGGPTSSSNGKKFVNCERRESVSADGSTSTNDVLPLREQKGGDDVEMNGEGSNAAAAAAAVAAEAAALGSGMLGLGVSKVGTVKEKSSVAAKAVDWIVEIVVGDCVGGGRKKSKDVVKEKRAAEGEVEGEGAVKKIKGNPPNGEQGDKGSNAT